MQETKEILINKISLSDMRNLSRHIIFYLVIILSLTPPLLSQDVPREFIVPPREFSVMPFWFWNDSLKDDEIVRQIADFEAHGVYGFVIHPRIGLPENMTWLSEGMIHAMNVAITEAARRNLYVVLYDEGMYPSGSSSGQVVARNPKHAARGLAKIDLGPKEEPYVTGDKKLVAILTRPGGSRVAVVDQPTGGKIRGLHYIGEGNSKIQEESPPAADILNPAAVESFIDLVYEKYYSEFGKYFGSTILGIFTDEPNPLGRDPGKQMRPGNLEIMPMINNIVGYDMKPFLADLWYADSPEATRHLADYYRAVNICLEENYYKLLGNWCKKHGVDLMGHPASSMDIGAERYFQVPGQDLVWRYVEPGPKALAGEHSTMAKCASGAMIHLGLRRNSNELYGAYGHNLTYDEMKWLANWCFVRGQNLLFPHAFYYSIRGPRYDERPPDVGPNSEWWNKYKPYADACSRLSWINTDSRHICSIAILAEATFLPDKPAKICFQHQYDFNYLEIRHLTENALTGKTGVQIAGMEYGAIILDTLSSIQKNALKYLRILAKNGRLIVNARSEYASMFKGAIVYDTPGGLISAIEKITSPDLRLSTASEGIRYRHIVKGADHFYLLFNEGNVEVKTRLRIPVKGMRQFLDPATAEAINIDPDDEITFNPHEMKIMRINTIFKLPPL